MSLTLTYTSLKAMIQTWAEDNDTEFTTALDNIIGLGELRVLRDLDLEIFDNVATGNFTTSSQDITKPSDFISLRSFSYVDGAGKSFFLTRKTYDFLKMYWRTEATTGTPLFYAEYSETTLKVAPTPSNGYTYEIRYIARPTGLSSSTATTWLSDNVADLLFKACMIESEKYLKEDPSEGGRVAKFEAEYRAELPKAKRELLRVQRSDYRPIAPATSPND